MSSRMFFDHRFYFICYLPGAGGSHLGNLIALDPTFSPWGLKSHNDYYQRLIEYYSSSTTVAHAVNHQIFDRHTPENNAAINMCIEQIDSAQYTNSIHLGHVDNFFNNRYFNNFANKRIILLSFDDPVSLNIVDARQSKLFHSASIGTTGLLNIINNQYLYSREYFEKMHHIDSLDLMQIELKRIFNTDISELITNINQVFELNIPLEQVTVLHKLWITKNNYEGKLS